MSPRVGAAVGRGGHNSPRAAHGTRWRYATGCKCPACRRVNRVTRRAYRADHKWEAAKGMAPVEQLALWSGLP